MALVVPSEGALQMATIVFNGGTQENFILALYTNDYTPVKGSLLSSFTLATGGGYAAKTLSNGSWTAATLDAVTYATYTAQTWSFTADIGDIYGYLIYGASSSKVFWAQKFASEEPTYSGKILQVTPYVEIG